jgi:acyl carrier protein
VASGTSGCCIISQITLEGGKNSMAIIKDLEGILLTEITGDPGRKSLDPDEDLLEEGIIDSLGIMKLVLSLEKTFGIEVSEEDVVPDNFQSLNSLAKFVEQKMQKKNKSL